MAKLLIKVQSFSDLITNSSSTVFLCKKDSNMSWNQLEDLIYKYTKDHLFKGTWDERSALTNEEREQYNFESGTCGFVCVESYSNLDSDSWKKYYFSGIKNPENYFIVNLDWSNYATINWLRENFNAEYID